MTTQSKHQFNINHIRYLNNDGSLEADAPDWVSDKETLLNLYKHMHYSRLFDKKAINLQRTGKLCTYPPSIGQEAIGVGIAYAMNDGDIYCPYYRDQSAHLMRGILPEEIYRYWGGHEDGNVYQNPARKYDLPICVPIGTQCLHAVGIAYALQYKKENKAVICSIGEGGTSQGDFYEALNGAGHWQLPLVFVVNNNQWAISIPRSEQTATETIAQKAIAAGMEGIVVDGNDVIAVAQTVKQALAKARNGGGPTLIEAQTYRLCDHTTADDASRYVPQEDLDKAWQQEPLIRLRALLDSQHQWNEEINAETLARLQSNIDAAAIRFLKQVPESADATWQHIYQSLPDAYIDQRNTWLKRANNAPAKPGEKS